MNNNGIWWIIGIGALILLATGGAVVYTETRGLRNNNPGNIRLGTDWQGMAANQTDPDFVQFISPEYGIRAMAKILDTYLSEGVDTIRSIITRWAPPSENDTQAYIDDVSSTTGIPPDQTVTSAQFPVLIGAIIQHENGINPYTSQVIDAGVAMA